MSKKVLVIDDEEDLRNLLSLTLSRMGLDAVAVETIGEAKQELEESAFDLCLTDMRLPDGNGMELVEFVQQEYPQMPIAVITAYGNVELAVDALKLGAFDFLSKPIELPRLRALVTQALEVPTETLDNTTNVEQQTLLLGDSQVMQKIRQQISKVARSQAPMFISGESGTGKELAARSIHQQGSRATKLFVPVNCGAIPGELMESEFFGHIKGSFTGAIDDKPGLFQAADGGTLFLDEVADLPLSMQVKLLRAIQEKRIRPVGSDAETDIDVRLISATHKDLQKAVNEGEFRSDLFYRLNVIDLHMPSLRDRPEDIALLAEHILERLNHESGFDEVSLSPKALQALQQYSFAGNVRELENILERASTLCENSQIQEEDLKFNGATSDINVPNPGVPHTTPPSEEIPSLDNYLQEIERDILVDALEKTRWNKTEAAKQLGISFRSIRYRLKKLGLEDE